jgi:hypothetical protein
MSKTSLYEAVKWLRQIRERGFDIFTAEQIRDIFKRGYFIKLINYNFIVSTGMVMGECGRMVHKWKINDIAIKSHKYCHVMYQD